MRRKDDGRELYAGKITDARPFVVSRKVLLWVGVRRGVSIAMLTAGARALTPALSRKRERERDDVA